MGRVFRTSRAEADLTEIWQYVAEDSVGSADRLLGQIDRTCRRVSEAPLSGRSRDELGASLRSVSVGKYVVFYRATSGGIAVIRVLHGARDLPELL